MKGRWATTTLAVLLLLGLAMQGASTSTAPFSYDRETLPGAKPWTSEDFNNDPDHFQFAVIGDRTGGADPRGIFERAMDQLNLLQPEFVINVGDAIEGYTEDRAQLKAEWDEFEAMVEKLEMPFFYTVGNHDLGNETMKQVWVQKRGATYYHFVYRDVLFVVLSSEDPPNPVPEGIQEKTAIYKRLQIEDPEAAQAMLEEFMASLASYYVPANFSDQQVDYVKEALARHPDVRWTFLFLHQPAWENPSEGFLAIEQLLEGRPYTFIAGHLHYYDIDKRKGRDYITMGPAGASWHKDGPGNVDHVLWVTMTDAGPRLAQITLDGLYDRGGRDPGVKAIYDREGGK